MNVLCTARLATCFCLVLVGNITLASPAGSGYHLVKSVPLGAAPGDAEYFDYISVDSAGRRIYIAHGAEVKVLDADNFSLVGSISGLKRSHGVALVPELNKGFITDGDAAKVFVFDIKTLKTTNEIKTYPDTDSITYDPSSKLVFTFNGDSKNSSVIDPVEETVIKTIDMGGGPEQPVADGKGTIYDNNEETSEVVVIDTHALTVKTRWSVKPAGQAVAELRPGAASGKPQEEQDEGRAGRDWQAFRISVPGNEDLVALIQIDRHPAPAAHVVH